MRHFATIATLLALTAFGQISSPIPDASASRRGLVNTTTQSFSGLKTFDGGIVTDLATGSTHLGKTIVTSVDGGVLVNLLSGSTYDGDTLVAVRDGGILVNLLTGSTLNGYTIISATTAALTLYVDPTGSDANACTASGTSACATINGAVAKIPHRILHDVTVNIAAGTYAEEVNLAEGQRLEGVNTATAASYRAIRVNFTGAALATYTPAAGNSTGTFTAPTRSGGFVTVTDASQSLTTDSLRGRFITFTGTGAGTFVISENTGTTITFLSSGTLPVTSTAYTLKTPSVIVTGAAAKLATFTLGTLGSNYVLTNLEVTNTTRAAVRGQPVALTSLSEKLGSWTGVNLRLVVGASGIGAATGGALSGSYASSTSGSFVVSNNGVLSGVVIDAATRGASVSPLVYTRVTSPLVDIRLSSTSSQFGMEYYGPAVGGGSSGNTGVRITCTGTTSGTGILVYSGASIGFGGGATTAPVTVTNCARAIQFGEYGYYTSPGSSFLLDTITCTNTFACLYLTGGDKLLMGAATMTGVTQEIVLDGDVPAGNVYTYAALLALTPQRINTTLGTVIRTWGN